MLVTRARDTSSYFAFCNLVGGQDELVFDGHSVVLDDCGRGRRARAGVRGAPPRRRHRSDRGDRAGGSATRAAASSIDRASGARGRGRRARCAGAAHGGASPTDRAVRARARADAAARSPSACATTSRRTASREVVVAVSGGIDSAVTAALCADALGPDRVHCVSMPSRYSSEGTRSDARAVAESLGCAFREIPIESTVGAFHDALAGEIEGGLAGLAAENLQARVRGVLLMALSNTYGWLVVSTGNKSELAVGYSTLYGDMVGGFALLKDVFKTDVYRLAEHLNERAGRDVIPREHDRARAERRAAGRPARLGLDPAVRRARPGARGVRRGGPLARGALGGVRPDGRRAGRRARRPRRVQAAAGAARREAPAEGVRPRPPHADHESLRGLTRTTVSSNLR